MRIGIVHVGWPLQPLVRDLVNGLDGQGHDVRLVATVEDDRGYVDLGTFRGTVELVPAPWPLAPLDRRLRRWLGRAVPGSVQVNPPWIRFDAGYALTRWSPCDLLIAVEKAGLDLAARASQRSGTPFVYYSLELYLEDHPGLAQFGWQRARERACHQRASGTIVQDQLRWQMLRTANGIAEQPVFLLPVGISGASPVGAATAAAPAADQPFRLLSFGMQGPGRFTHELVAAATRLPAGISIHLHGPVYDPATKQLASGPLPPAVRFSTEVLPEHELPKVLAGAHVGLALYHCDYANDRLTAYSSQKVASYLQAGLPIIAFRNVAYEDLLTRFHCGELVDDLGELGAAARRIRDDYPAYQAAAHAAFASIYRLDRYWPALSTFLAECARR